MTFTGQFAYPAQGTGPAHPFPAWPPFPTATGPQAPAAPTAGASGERGDAGLAAVRRAGLASLSADGCRPEPSPRLAAFAGEIARAGSDRVAAALDRELARRAELFITGLEAYRRHPCRRAAGEGRSVWQEGTTRLLDYGEHGGKPVLVIPSLINRHYILDLLPERSFVRFLRGAGLRPLVVDWGEPGRGRAPIRPRRLHRRSRSTGYCTAIGEGPIAVIGLLHGRPLGAGLGTAPRHRHRRPRAAGDAVGFPRRTAGAAARLLGAVKSRPRRTGDYAAALGHPEALFLLARPVPRGEKVHPLRRA